MTTPPLPAAAPHVLCPICGGPNSCVPAASGRLDTPCWCSDASFSADLLERVPANQRRAACICASCAAAAAVTVPVHAA